MITTKQQANSPMLTKADKKVLREDLFRHLDGIVTAPTAYALYQKGVLQFIAEEGQLSLAQLVEKFDANEGYLNVAFRVLSAQAWLTHTIQSDNSIDISITERGRIALNYIPKYKGVVDLMKLSGNYHHRKFEMEPFRIFEQIFTAYQDQDLVDEQADELTQSVQYQVKKHIEGVLVGPTVVLLGMNGMFHKYFMEASFSPDEFHNDPESFGKILNFFTFLGWFNKKGTTYQFTQKGLFFAKRSSAYGVTVSYIPTFRKMEELIFGNPRVLWDTPENSPELHVDRAMNVWGSGGAHSTYFKKIDEVIIDLFNKPIEEQPKGIIDMGCGDGTFLVHLFDVIERRTKRGQMLEEYPLFLIGVDYNRAALKATKSNIIKADVWAKVIWGDISDPQLLEKDLAENYGIEMKDLLNVRTFLDHNRIWSTPKKESKTSSTSTGAYAFRGERLSNQAVEQNLREHLQNWMPYIERFGLLMIELHTIPSALTAQNLGRTAATAYDATHGFSDQYIVELEVMNRIIEEVGLQNVAAYHSKYPNSDLATVSINYLKGT